MEQKLFWPITYDTGMVPYRQFKTNFQELGLPEVLGAIGSDFWQQKSAPLFVVHGSGKTGREKGVLEKERVKYGTLATSGSPPECGPQKISPEGMWPLTGKKVLLKHTASSFSMYLFALCLVGGLAHPDKKY